MVNVGSNLKGATMSVLNTIINVKQFKAAKAEKQAVETNDKEYGEYKTSRGDKNFVPTREASDKHESRFRSDKAKEAESQRNWNRIAPKKVIQAAKEQEKSFDTDNSEKEVE